MDTGTPLIISSTKFNLAACRIKSSSGVFLCVCVIVSLHLPPHSSGVAAHLLVQTLQLHLQGLQEALPLDQLALSSSQSLVALLHLGLHRLQLDTKNEQECTQ